MAEVYYSAGFRRRVINNLRFKMAKTPLGHKIYTFDTYSGTSNTNVGVVNPNGNIEKGISTVGNSSFNFGYDALKRFTAIQ